MNPDDFKKYSNIPAIHFECDDGWENLLHTTFFLINEYLERNKIDFKFTQIKEKFGGLRCYTQGGDDFIDGVISFAEDMSYKTCEITGDKGSLCKKGYWYKTLSPDQAEKLGYVVAKA